MLHMPTATDCGAGSETMDSSFRLDGGDVPLSSLDALAADDSRRHNSAAAPLRAPSPAPKVLDPLKAQLSECARESGGPASARSRAAAPGEAYPGMPAPE